MGASGVAGGLIFFIILQLVAAALRVWVRVFMVKRFGWDDASMLLTLVLSIAFCSVALEVYALTHLQSIYNITFSHIFPAIKLTLAVECIYIIAALFLKVSLGLLLLRVLIAKWQIRTIYGVLAVSSSYGLFYFFFVLLQCGNPTDFPLEIVKGQCLSRAAINGTSYTHAAINAVADCIFLFLPVTFLRKADMSRRSKLSVGCILGLGSVGGICTLVRIGYIDTLTKPTVTYFQTSQTIVITSAAELSIGITCICFSTYKPLVRYFFPRSLDYDDENASPQQSRSAQSPSTGAQEMTSMSGRAWSTVTHDEKYGSEEPHISVATDDSPRWHKSHSTAASSNFSTPISPVETRYHV